MLFSQPDLATYVSDTFEPAWQRLRDAPQVTIDFGEGRVVRRTLHGNVLTWICDAQGRALDAIPGVCTPEVFRVRLEEARRLAVMLAKKPVLERDAAFRAYHIQQAKRIELGKKPLVIVQRTSAQAFVSKVRIEDPLEYVLATPEEVAFTRDMREGRAQFGAAVARAANQPAEADATRIDRAALEADTKLNETVRRRAVHELLAAAGPAAPADLTKRVYREVLGVDLDDPYLGLGKLLFETYPFER